MSFFKNTKFFIFMTTAVIGAGMLMSAGCGEKQVDSKPATVTEIALDNLNAKTIDESIDKLADKSAKKEIIVTFIELGSVNCIPCKMMQPVMNEVERKYGNQVKVVFYDVWTPQGEPYGRSYGIRAIPTQIFLDKNGKEFFRHAGFYPFEEVEKVLKRGGVR